MDYAFADLHLARRLEQAEGGANAAFVAARARLEPAVGAARLERTGTFALFDGAESPLTQTFGLGLSGEVSDGELDALEAFFRSRGAPVAHELSPLAGVALAARLVARGYRPVEQSTVLHRPSLLPGDEAGPADISVRPVEPDEADRWAEVAAQGWGSEAPELEAFIRGMGRISARAAGVVCFLAEREGRAIATGSLFVGDGVALLAGASTLGPERGRGAQRALLEGRLRHAATRGAHLAMMVAQPGSGSQRNAERRGFRVAYTRTKWQLD